MSAFAARYARAFADIVVKFGLDSSETQRQLEDFSQTLAANRDLREALLNPAIPLKNRIAVLEAVTQRLGADRKVQNFLAVVTEHGRLGTLKEILEQFRSEMNRRSTISETEIISARKLEGQERADLEKQAALLARTAVRASFREDATLLGGAIVRIGSTIYDGSVRGRLERLKDQLVAP